MIIRNGPLPQYSTPPSSNEPVKQSSCTRCRRQKLRCIRTGSSNQCMRCQRAKVTCVSLPVRVGRPPRNLTGQDTVIGALPSSQEQQQQQQQQHIRLDVFENTSVTATLGAGRESANGDHPIISEPPAMLTVISSLWPEQDFVGSDPLSERLPAVSRTTAAQDKTSQGPSSSLGNGQLPNIMHRLNVLYNRISPLSEECVLKSFPHSAMPGQCSCRRGLLDQVLKHCSDLTALVAEIGCEPETSSHAVSNPSRWSEPSLADLSDAGAWSACHATNPHASPPNSGEYLCTDATAAFSLDILPHATGNNIFDGQSTEPGTRKKTRTTSRGLGDRQALAQADVAVVLMATACYVQVKRALSGILRQTYQALVAGNEDTLKLLLSAAASHAAPTDFRARETLRVKITMEIVLHVVGCLEDSIGIHLHADEDREESAEKEQQPGESCGDDGVCDLYSAIIHSAAKAENATSPLRNHEGQVNQCALRAEIEKVMDYVGRSPSF